MQNLGQKPLPLRGLQRFMQKRGMDYPVFPQGANFQGEAGNIGNTLDVQALPEKSGGIKSFLNKLSWKNK